MNDGESTTHSTHLDNEDLAKSEQHESSTNEDPASTNENPELLKRLAIIDKLEQWLQAMPNIRFIDPRETTESYRWFNKIIDLKWNANAEKPTDH